MFHYESYIIYLAYTHKELYRYSSRIRHNLMYQRAVAHMDLDAFYVSVECLKNSAFKGKPILIGGNSARGVVASCSYEARRFGVHSAMPMKMALRLCPQATVIRGDMDSYSKYSNLVTDIIADKAPIFEKASIDEFYLDLTGMDKYFGCLKWTDELRATIMKESGLPISFGLSVNKLVSKVCTDEAKPNGRLHINRGKEKHFLAPLSPRKLPGVGNKTYKRLSMMGVRTIKTLSLVPLPMLKNTFGKNGVILHQRANAIDDRPVVPYSEQKSISKEHTFHEDLLDLNSIKSKLIALCEQVTYELRQAQKLTACVSVKLRYADFNTHTKQKTIPYTALDNDVIDMALILFDQLYQKRQLIRLIGIKVSHLVHGSYQMNLFEDTQKDIDLMNTLDDIRNKFGSHSIQRAVSLD